MKHIPAIILVCILFPAIGTQAQVSYGFRAGLSYSKLLGDSQLDDNGNALDSYRFASGFHIGFTMNYAVTDLFGFRGELIFTQRGTEYKYAGDSYYFLAKRTTDERLIFGKRTEDYNVSMASFEVPLLAYYKIGSFEICGGVNTAVILSSTGGGSIVFNGVTSTGKDIDPFKVILQYNFNKDKAQEASSQMLEVKVNNTLIATPATVGAYYDFDEKHGNKYNAFDFGLTGGLSYFLNEGLYIGGRVTYGLLDADDNQYDISLYKLDENNNYIYRNDKNRHLAINASLGFLF